MSMRTYAAEVLLFKKVYGNLLWFFSSTIKQQEYLTLLVHEHYFEFDYKLMKRVSESLTQDMWQNNMDASIEGK